VKKNTEDSLTKEESVSVSGNSRWELMQKLAREGGGSRTVCVATLGFLIVILFLFQSPPPTIDDPAKHAHER